MEIINLIKELNNSARPFYFKERSVSNKTLIDVYSETPECIKYLKDYVGKDNLPENVIPGYFVSESLQNNPYYIFSIKNKGLTKSDIRIKSDDELIKLFDNCQLSIIESECNRFDIDPIEVGRVYYLRNSAYGLIVLRITDIIDLHHVKSVLLRSKDKSLIKKIVNVYLNDDLSVIIEFF